MSIRNSNTDSSSLIRSEDLALFGEPPLLKNEDPSRYWRLYDQFEKRVAPKDIIERLWVRDIIDLSWEILRLRRYKTIFIEHVRSNGGDGYLALTFNATSTEKPTFEGETGSARIFLACINSYGDIDALLASAEARRDRMLREIESRREALARRLRKASDEIIDGQFEEAPPLAPNDAEQ